MKHTVLIILAIFTQIVSNGRANEEDFIPPLLMYYGGGSIAGLLVPRNEMSHGQIVWRNLLSEGELGDVTLYRKSSESVEWNLSDSGNEAVNLTFHGDERIVNDRASDGVTTIYHLSPNNSGFCIPGNWDNNTSDGSGARKKCYDNTTKEFRRLNSDDFFSCQQDVFSLHKTITAIIYRSQISCCFTQHDILTTVPDERLVSCKYQLNPIPESYGRGGIPYNVGLKPSFEECVDAGEYNGDVNGVSYSTVNHNCTIHIGMISVQFTDSAEITVQDWQTAFLFPNHETRIKTENTSPFIVYAQNDHHVGLLVPRNEKHLKQRRWRNLLINGEIGTVHLQRYPQTAWWKFCFFDLREINDLWNSNIISDFFDIPEESDEYPYLHNIKPELSGYCIPALGTSTVMTKIHQIPNAASLSDCIEQIRDDITEGTHFNAFGHITGMMYSIYTKKCHFTAASDSELNVEDLQVFISCEFQINPIPNSYGRGNEDVDLGKRSFDECVGVAYNNEDVSGISHSQTEDYCIGHKNMTWIQLSNSIDIYSNSVDIDVANWQTAFLPPIYRIPIIPFSEAPALIYVGKGNDLFGMLMPTHDEYYGQRVWRNIPDNDDSPKVMLRKTNIKEWEFSSTSPSLSFTFAGVGNIVPHGTMSNDLLFDDLLSDYGNAHIYHLVIPSIFRHF